MELREGFVEANGHQLAYLSVNEHLANKEQPAIVFIHGVLASVNFWLDAVPADFKDKRAWYALSLPAHHPSAVPADFAPEQVDEQWFFDVMNGALKELLGERKAIIVGHSTGGFSALNLAIHQAPNVIGIISVAGFHSGKWGGPEGMLVKLAGLGSWAKGPFAANVMLASKSHLIQRVFAGLLAHNRKAYRASPLSQRMIENIRPNVSQQDPAALFPLFNGISRLEIADQLHRITMPCYLFAGTHDPVVPAEQSLRLAGEIEHAKTIVFQDVGHMPFMEAAEDYFAALEQAVADITDQYQQTKPSLKLVQKTVGK
ncbi:MAG: alpha/beta hydrolase [Salinisphaeraceae bacterium]|nr:alpha/beta hydrolase [Salinisphaeraceae bacterium]